MEHPRGSREQDKHRVLEGGRGGSMAGEGVGDVWKGRWEALTAYEEEWHN